MSSSFYFWNRQNQSRSPPSTPLELSCFKISVAQMGIQPEICLNCTLFTTTNYFSFILRQISITRQSTY